MDMCIPTDRTGQASCDDEEAEVPKDKLIEVAMICKPKERFRELPQAFTKRGFLVRKFQYIILEVDDNGLIFSSEKARSLLGGPASVQAFLKRHEQYVAAKDIKVFDMFKRRELVNISD